MMLGTLLFLKMVDGRTFRLFTNIIKKKPDKTEMIMHVDYDKKKKIFYTNLYFPDCKYVLKSPIASIEEDFSYKDYKLEKFDLMKFSYLFYY